MDSIGISLKSGKSSDEENEEGHKADVPKADENAKQEGLQENSDSSIQVHLNIWKPAAKGLCQREVFYLDIGIMTKFHNDNVKIYLPYELGKDTAASDLGHILTENKPILCALFNEDYDVSQVPSGCYHLVSLNEPKEDGDGEGQDADTLFASGKTPDSFYLYPLGANDIQTERCQDAEGSMISITIPNPLDGKYYYYIRFRVAVIGGIALKTDLSANLIQSAFTRLDMYNIQLNETRDIPYGPKGVLTSSGFRLATFSKIHILYISNPKVSVDNGNSKGFDSRIIEVGKWQPYLPSSISPDTYIAHHWKFVAKKSGTVLKKGNLFLTARYPKNQFFTLLAYLFVVIVLGCCGSLCASLLYGLPGAGFNLVWLWLVGGMAFYISAWYFITHYVVHFSVEPRSTVRK